MKQRERRNSWRNERERVASRSVCIYAIIYCQRKTKPYSYYNPLHSFHHRHKLWNKTDNFNHKHIPLHFIGCSSFPFAYLLSLLYSIFKSGAKGDLTFSSFQMSQWLLITDTAPIYPDNVQMFRLSCHYLVESALIHVSVKMIIWFGQTGGLLIPLTYAIKQSTSNIQAGGVFCFRF